MSTLSDKEREEFSMLLPWYANGTLDDADHDRVEKALREDDELAKEFDLILEDQAAVMELAGAEEVPASMEARFNIALNAEIEREQVASAPVASEGQPGLFSQMAALLFPSKPVAYMATAAALVVMVQSGVILSMLTSGQQGSQYTTASGEEETAAATSRFLVQFKDEADMGEVSKLLAQFNGQIAKGPTADGFFELEFAESVSGVNLADELGKRDDLFQFVLPGN